MCRRSNRLTIGTTPGGESEALVPIPVSISRAYGPLAGGGAALTIRGANFTDATGVTFGAGAASSVTVVNDTTITCVPPAGTSGAKDVVVQHANGDGTLAGAYTYQAGPDLSGASLDVTTGAHYGGDLVTVSGAARIEEGATATLGGVSHPVTRLSSTSFSFVTKAVATSALGAKDLVVTNPDTQTGTKSSAFTYFAGEGAEFTSGAAMDAAAVVGRSYKLMGSTTGALIARCLCVATGPVRYDYDIEIDLRQSNGGAELDGVLSFEALGTGSVPSWASSTPGNADTGGPRLAGTGTCKLNGLAGFSGVYCPFVKVEGYLVARSGDTTNDIIAVGFVKDSDDTTISGGGFGKSGTGHANCGFSDAAVNGPSPGFNTNYSSAPPDASERWDLTSLLHQYALGGAQVLGAAHNAGQVGLRSSTPDASNGHVAASDLQPAFTKVGTWEYHVNKIKICA